MKWINFLHLYQPANIESIFIKEAVNKSYRRLVQLLEKKTNLKMTMNIAACLIDRLEEEGYQDLINRFKKLVAAGRLELVGSAAFHGFLPRLPLAEVEEQIIYQEKTLNRVFHIDRPRGFFIPEMAYHPQVAKLVASRGYQWLILDEITWAGPGKLDQQKVYQDENSGLKIIFRHRQLSASYPPDEMKRLRRQKDLPPAIITAADGELYGLRHNDPGAELERIVFWSILETSTISEFISSQKIITDCQLRASSWESTESELAASQPYLLWDNPDNKIQKLLWELADLVLSLKQESLKDNGYQWYRWHLNRGLASCWWWWASAYDLTRNFGPLAWNPDLVEKGVNDLVRAVRSLTNSSSVAVKIKTEELACKIRQVLWAEHWQKHWTP